MKVLLISLLTWPELEYSVSVLAILKQRYLIAGFLTESPSHFCLIEGIIINCKADQFMLLINGKLNA